MLFSTQFLFNNAKLCVRHFLIAIKIAIDLLQPLSKIEQRKKIECENEKHNPKIIDV